MPSPSRLTPALLLLAGLIALSPSGAGATQMKLEDPNATIIRNGMLISAEYIQPVDLNFAPTRRADADAYVQLNVNARFNPFGFSRYAWIPYLGVTYRLEKVGTDWHGEGTLDPAIANYGPHYGSNVKLDGVGDYILTVRITAPERTIYRHVSPETGMTWWEPFELSWKFTYLGLGKRGKIGGSGGGY